IAACFAVIFMTILIFLSTAAKSVSILSYNIFRPDFVPRQFSPPKPANRYHLPPRHHGRKFLTPP
ncbi:hypothetical protein M569_08127, partial [Genlisea aurea]